MSPSASSVEVSVIMAAYNAADSLATAVRSVLAQTVMDLELIIVDDCSQDRTLETAHVLAVEDSRIKVVASEKNGGPAAARNLGLNAATGRWIAIVDADDVILPDRFKSMIAGCDGFDIVFDNLFSLKDGQRRYYVPEGIYVPGPLTLSAFIDSHLRSSRYPNLGFLKPMIRRETLERMNLRYDTALLIGEDARLIMDMLMKGASARFIDGGYYQYERRGNSISMNQSNENLRAITLSYQNLADANVLGESDLRALHGLIRHNRGRIAAKDVLEKKSLASAIRLLATPSGWSHFYYEGGATFKKMLRARF